MEDGDKVTEWLIDEARDAGRRISEVMSVDEKVLATGITVIGLAATVAVAQQKPYLLMAIPGALAALFCFIAYRYAEAFAISGYKVVLERAIRKRLGGIPVVAWESEIARRRYKSPATLLLGVVLTALYVGASYLAVTQARATEHPHHWGHSHSGLLVALTIGSIAAGAVVAASALWQAIAERARTENFAQERLYPAWICADDVGKR
jgi:hypothetical protein